MKTVIVDASVAIKWAAPEALSEQAIWILTNARLAAPDLLIAECANILWKKVRSGEFDAATARLAAGAIMRTDIELAPMRQSMAGAVDLAVELDHPAYDCLYLALAIERKCPLVTADTRLVNRLAQSGNARLAGLGVALVDAPATLGDRSAP